MFMIYSNFISSTPICNSIVLRICIIGDQDQVFYHLIGTR